jgi:signal transduction histidine kinase
MKLRTGIAPLVAFALSLGLIVASFVMAGYEERLFREKAISEVSGQAQILAASVTAALAFDDAKTAQEYVNALRANPDIEAAAVYLPSGARLAGFTTAAPLPHGVTNEYTRFENDRLVVFLPAVQGKQRLGFVYIKARIESVERRYLRYAVLVVLMTMAALILTVLAISQGSLARAHRLLESHARNLSETNLRLEREMQERAKIEEALRQSQKMEALGQLSGGIAHDFNNLLAAIKGNIQLLERRLAQGRTDIGKYIAGLKEGADRATALTQRVLAFSRRQPLANMPVNLSLLVGGMHDLIRQSVGSQIEIRTNLHPDAWTVCDPNQMENVLLNLAINGRDAMPEGGVLMVTTRIAHFDTDTTDVSAGDYISLSVSDTGNGMTEDIRQKAIEPFFTTKPPGQGTGLGLSSIFGYVKQSGGHLKIDSVPGEGTTVTILLPHHGERQNSGRVE